MYLKQQIAIVLTAATLVTCQSTGDLPDCAKAGALQAIAATSCQPTDTACICKSNNFINALEQYAKTNCSPTDYDTAIIVGESLCAQAGVTVTSSSSSSSSTATNTAAATITASMSASTTASGNTTVVTETRCECEEETSTSTIAPVATYTGVAARSGNAAGTFMGLVAVLEILAFL